MTNTQLAADVRQLIDEIIKQEGGWKLTHNADDPDGGWTYAGVTRKTYEAFVSDYEEHTNIPLAQIKDAIVDHGDLLQNHIYLLYYKNYYRLLKLDKLPTSIRGPLFSCSVNIGVVTAIKILQTACNCCVTPADAKLAIDGQLGPKTLSIITDTILDLSPGGTGEIMLHNDFLREWMRYYINLVQENAKDWQTACVFYRSCARAKEDLSEEQDAHYRIATLRATFLEGWFNRVEYWRK